MTGWFPTDRKHWVVLIGFTIFYFLWSLFFMDFRVDHLSFYFLISILFLVHRESRTFVYCLVFFSIFWILYDSMRMIPNYLVSDVNILQPYELEKSIFGIDTDGIMRTPSEWFSEHRSIFLDFMTGFFYLTWVPIPLGLGIYLYFKDRKMLLRFSAAYLFTNLVGFSIYYSYPAAPPWYYATYGNQLLLDVKSSAAELVRFDRLIGHPLFENLYTKNSNVFAAIPSLHSAYPVIAFYYARQAKLKWLSIIIFIDIIGIWFSAIYSFHHYLIDVVAGLMCALVGLFIFEKIVMKSKFKDWLNEYLKFVHS